jgi:LPS O-antigen subunit length determinant protein (WzzB/FepE family)
LGGLGGGSTGSGGSLSVNLYPDITHSTPFLMGLIEEEFYFSSLDTTVTLLTYFSEIQSPPLTKTLKQYTLGIPKMLINLPLKWINSMRQKDNKVSVTKPQVQDVAGDHADSDDNTSAFEPLVVNNQQLAVMNELKGRITTTIEPNGTLMVSAKMPDPVVSAKVTEMAVVFLTNYVKDYKVEKAREDLEFIQAQFEEKEERYNQAQSRLARLRDRNLNIVSESARIEVERAQTEFNLAFSLYQGIAQQLEQAKIKLQEETPLFKVLEPVQVPLSKSEPNQELIVILFTIGGMFVGIGIIFFKVIYQQLKQSFS